MSFFSPILTHRNGKPASAHLSSVHRSRTNLSPLFSSLRSISIAIEICVGSAISRILFGEGLMW